MRLALFLTALALPVSAQEGLRPADLVFDRAEMKTLLSGQIIEFFDGSKSRYDADGTYGYTYTDDGPVWSGVWRTDAESRVCVDFDNGSSRCDHIVKDGERTILIIADGTRFPVRRISDIAE